MILLIISTRYFPWRYIEGTIIENIQFPYRLYTLAFPLLAIGLGLLLDEIENKYSGKRIVVTFGYILLFAVTFYCGYRQIRTVTYSEETSDITEEYFLDKYNTAYIGSGEWLPYGSHDSILLETERVVVDEYGSSVEYTDGYNSVSFRVEDDTTYYVPLLYYKGYCAMLRTEDGKEESLNLYSDLERGNIICVVNDTEETGTVTVWYKGTSLQKISVIISLFALAMVFLLIYRRRIRKTSSAEV